eukprot:gene306-328_t
MGCQYSITHRKSQHSEEYDGQILTMDNISDLSSEVAVRTSINTPLPRTPVDSIILVRDRQKKEVRAMDCDQEISDEVLQGRTFMQSPLGKKVHFNLQCITPKRRHRAYSNESSIYAEETRFNQILISQ